MAMSLLVFILLFVLCFVIYKYEPRTIFLGLVMILVAIQSVVMFLIFNFNNLALIMGIILGILFLIIPVVLTLGFLSKHRKLFKCLIISLFVGIIISILLYLNEINVIEILQLPLITWGIGYFVCGICLGILVVNSYLLSALMNLFSKEKPSVDYLIVLGAGLNKEKVTPLLAKRIDKAIQVYKEAPDLILIMSGGQGDDEMIPEGLAMANYAISQGVPKNHIIIEDQSVNTYENILFSSQHFASEDASFAIISTMYHLFRAELIAKKLGLKSVSYGAESGKKWVFNANAFIREFFAYLYMQLKWVILFSILYTLLYSLLHYVVLMNAFPLPL